MSYEEIKKFIKDNNIRNKREFSMKKNIKRYMKSI